MTAPVPNLPPPANPYGRTAKELLGYSGKSPGNNNPGSIGGIPDESIPFNTLFGFVGRVIDVPAVADDFTGFNKNFYDTTLYTHARIVVDVAAAGLDTMFIQLMCNPDPTASPAGWLDAGFAGTPLLLYLDNGANPHYSPWMKLDTAARANVAWNVVIGGGDGATDVVLGAGAIQFSQRISPPMDRWYWRIGQPAIEPNFLQAATYYGDFWGPNGAPQVLWTTPTQATVRDGPGILYRQIGPAGGTQTTCDYAPADHSDPSGVIHRFVGAPLKAQTIPAGALRHYFVGTAPSATGTGWLQVIVSLYRPGVGVVEEWASTARHFRFTPTVREIGTVIPIDTPCLAGDRFVVDLIGNFNLAPGGANVANSPIWIDYNGNVEDLPIGSTTSLGNHASYTEFPLLQYQSLIP